MMLCAYTTALLRNEKKESGRPFVSATIGGRDTIALYDTGADITCMSESEFRKIPPEDRPEKMATIPGQEFQSANGLNMEVKGAYNLKMRILGRDISHKIFIVRNLSEALILGADFLHLHHLSYCPARKTVYWPGGNQWIKGHAQLNQATKWTPFQFRP